MQRHREGGIIWHATSMTTSQAGFGISALKVIEQFMGLCRTEHTADRFGWYERGHGLVDLMTLRKFRLEVDRSGRRDARVGERPGIYNDYADEATGPIIGERETRHTSNLGRTGRPCKVECLGKSANQSRCGAIAPSGSVSVALGQRGLSEVADLVMLTFAA
jgi:hypothetical protein